MLLPVCEHAVAASHPSAKLPAFPTSHFTCLLPSCLQDVCNYAEGLALLDYTPPAHLLRSLLAHLGPESSTAGGSATSSDSGMEEEEAEKGAEQQGPAGAAAFSGSSGRSSSAASSWPACSAPCAASCVALGATQTACCQPQPWLLSSTLSTLCCACGWPWHASWARAPCRLSWR